MSLKKNKILIISQYLPPDISGGGTRAFNYATCLSEKNYDVTVITAHPHLHGPVSKEYRHKLMRREKMNGFDVIRVWVPSLLHTSARNRIILHFSFLLFSLLPIGSIKPDIIFASEPNLFSIIPAYIYSKLRGAKVIRVIDDLWPEVIYERGYVRSSLLKRFLDWLAKFSYDYPKYILPLTEEAKEYVSKTYGIDKEKIIVLEHGVDTKIYSFREKEKSDIFCVMYSGALVESYDFELIINAAKKLKNIKFVLRGKGHLVSYLKEQKEKFQLDNLVIDSKIVPFNELSSILDKADVLVIPMKNEFTLNLSLPTKILEYQAIGRPIICCSSGAPGNYVEKTKSGIRVDYDDLDGFIDAILKLESNQSLCAEYGKNGRKFIEDNLTFNMIGNRLSRILETLTPKVNLPEHTE